MLDSVFLLSESVLEEEESWSSIFLLFLVAVGKSSLHVVVLTSEDLNFIELLENVLNKSSCTLLEGRDSFSLSLFLELALEFL